MNYPTKLTSISISGLHAWFAKRTIVHATDFVLPASKFIAVLGVNGIGKTTLLRTLVGNNPYGKAEVRLNTKLVLSELSAIARARLCTWIPAPSSLAFPYSVFEVVLMGRYPHHLGLPSAADRAITMATLKYLNLADLQHRNVNTLSSGERQLVLLARGINCHSALLVIDEPTASLDANRELQVLRHLRKLTQQGCTVIAAMHNLQCAYRFSDVVLTIDAGKLTVYNPTAKAFVPAVVGEMFNAHELLPSLAHLNNCEVH